MGDKEALLESLQALVFGCQADPLIAPKGEDTPSTKPSGSVDGSEGISPKDSLDTLSDPKLRRLHLSQRDLSNESRMPVKRYFDRQEFAEAVAAKMSKRENGTKGGSSWLQKLRDKRSEEKENPEGLLPAVPRITVQKQSTRAIRKGDIRLKRLRDPTRSSKHLSAVTALGICEEDSGKPLLWSTGPDKSVKIYSLASETMDSIIEVKKCPIWDASLGLRKQLYCISDQASIFALDLERKLVTQLPRFLPGKNSVSALKKILAFDNNLIVLESNGRMFHLDQRTNRVVRTYNSGSSITSLTYDHQDSSLFYSGDKEGDVFAWNIGEGRCIKRERIAGSLGVTNIASAGRNRVLVACESAMIAMFNPSDFGKPLKSFSNLGLPANILLGHPVAPLCLAASSTRAHTLRLINTMESGFVYQNWPGESTIFGRVTAGAFSRDGRWLTIGNDNGLVRLWKMPDLEAAGDLSVFA